MSEGEKKKERKKEKELESQIVGLSKEENYFIPFFHHMVYVEMRNFDLERLCRWRF